MNKNQLSLVSLEFISILVIAMGTILSDTKILTPDTVLGIALVFLGFILLILKKEVEIELKGEKVLIR